MADVMTSKWSRAFKPIALGDGRTIASLGAAREFLLALAPTARDGGHWRYADELLRRAADRNEKYSTMDARAQMVRALRTEGLLELCAARPTPDDSRRAPEA